MVDAFMQAVYSGFIAWHAFPFNTEPEMYDTSLFTAGIAIAQQLVSIIYPSDFFLYDLALLFIFFFF